MRQAGILAPIFSLPGAYGAGDFGQSSFAFIDYLKSTGMKIWQLLPLNPISYGHSPYQPLSSFAGEVLYIDLDALVAEGLLSEVPAPPATDPDRVEYEILREYKIRVLREAYKNFTPDAEYEAFIQKDWVFLYGVFATLKKKNDLKPWTEWIPEDRDWILTKPELPAEIQAEVRFQMFLQYLFFTQWHRVRAYAKDAGIKIMGDIPFYVGHDSLDVWMNQQCFLLDETGYPSSVAGVPPDYFAADGQRWGNPIYDWDYLKETGYRFWIERLTGTAELFDMIRIDHFRAFDTYWKIKASCPTAVDGEWIEAPGYDFFDTVLPHLKGTMIVAEDLGMMRDEVYELRDHFKFPGMNVIMFTLLDEEFESKKNMFIYTGTHDNDTIEGWWASLTEEEQEECTEELEKRGINTKKGTKAEQFTELVLRDVPEYCVLPLQDILGLGSEARINVPSTINDKNWTFRLRDMNGLYEKAEWLQAMLRKSRRIKRASSKMAAAVAGKQIRKKR